MVAWDSEQERKPAAVTSWAVLFDWVGRGEMTIYMLISTEGSHMPSTRLKTGSSV